MSEENKNLVLDLGGAKEAIAEGGAHLLIGVQDVIIVDVAWKQLDNEKKTEYIAITLTNSAKTLMNEEKFFLSEKALDHTRGAIKHLVHAAVGEAAAAQAYSIEALKKLLIGKGFRANIVGEEFESSDGNIYVKTQLAYNGFAESLTIPLGDSGLKARPNPKKLKISPMSRPTVKTDLANVADDLSF